MSNVLEFPGTRRSTENVSTAPSPRTSYQKRKRNSPFRRLWYTAEMAMVEVNKTENRHTPDEIEKIRRGVAAAQELADELSRAAKPFLTGRPRRTNSQAMARRRDFGEAMRRRIRNIALFRDLSVDEIKPALTLKHHEIAKFTEKHGVNLEWLLEGKGSIFKNGPIAPNSIRSAAELAALVQTLPEAEQRKIEAVVDLFLAERSR
ncbi:hypothetical protein [Bradyrhizobium sp. AUGA SZCCT0283]|uniref:hypothetical protein n=1 Tax=Bradyrhizobium sp. AUGA SZCCT0283 TaxID=2807671 RepID=UPI001BA86994|nr:hypothetical protein [Bradyrhizobium sp. AUGA SZCCT0283]MBR1277737.1 hypothetical protein [Bradyrhizobium sp. AUGA SZCCT0283]